MVKLGLEMALVWDASFTGGGISYCATRGGHFQKGSVTYRHVLGTFPSDVQREAALPLCVTSHTQHEDPCCGLFSARCFMIAGSELAT